MSPQGPALSVLPCRPVPHERVETLAGESQNWNGILGGLDPTLLLHLAMGHTCYIHDYGLIRETMKSKCRGQECSSLLIL